MEKMFTKREVIRICIEEILLFILLLNIIFLGVKACDYSKEKARNAWRYIVVTDETTGLTYEGKENTFDAIVVPYDEQEHTFSYVVKKKRSSKSIESSGTAYGLAIKERGEQDAFPILILHERHIYIVVQIL